MREGWLFLVLMVACQSESEPPPGPTPQPVLSARAVESTRVPPPAPRTTAATPPPLLGSDDAGTIRVPTARSVNAGGLGPVDPSGDRAWLTRLRRAPIASVVPNSGGSTLTLRARFADGARAIIKLRQTRHGEGHRAEIAAYHLDRLLGFGRTAAVAGRRLPFAALRQHLVSAGARLAFLDRFDREVVHNGEAVEAALIAWHAGPLRDAAPPPDWTRTLRSATPLEPALQRRLPEWSDLVVFDTLIGNTDRWSGDNVLSLGKGGPLIFLDNAASFRYRGLVPSAPLPDLCRFRAATLQALSTPLAGDLEASLAQDALGPVLPAAALAAMDRRRQHLLEHVKGCENELGRQLVRSL